MVISSNLLKLSTVTIASFTTSTRTGVMVQTNRKELRAITMCNTFKPDYWYENDINKFLVSVHCPNKMCSGKLCVLKKAFQSLNISDYQCPQCASI